jgi:TonB family protein
VRRSYVVSSVAHAAFLVLVISPGFQRARNQMIEVMNVRLVGEERKAEPKIQPKQVKPPEPEPQPEKKPEEPKMAYKTQTKTRQTKQEVKPAQEKPKPEPPKQTSTPPAGPAPKTDAPKVPAVSTSSVRVDGEDFRFDYYLEIIRERVSFNWSPPPVTGQSGMIATVYFRVSRNGKVTNVRVEQTSGFDLFDKAALRAVNQSGPLPPLPAGFDGSYLGVHFEFQQTSG